MPFEILVERLAPHRDPSHNPVFQVTFGLQSALTEKPRLPGIDVTWMDAQNHTSKVDLALNVLEAEDGSLTAVFEYDSALSDRETVQRWAGCYRRLLAAVAADPDVPVSRLPVLSDAEQAHLLALGTEIGRAHV